MKDKVVDDSGNVIERKAKFPRQLVDPEKCALLRAIAAVGGVEVRDGYHH